MASLPPAGLASVLTQLFLTKPQWFWQLWGVAVSGKAPTEVVSQLFIGKCRAGSRFPDARSGGLGSNLVLVLQRFVVEPACRTQPHPNPNAGAGRGAGHAGARG